MQLSIIKYQVPINPSFEQIKYIMSICYFTLSLQVHHLLSACRYYINGVRTDEKESTAETESKYQIFSKQLLFKTNTKTFSIIFNNTETHKEIHKKVGETLNLPVNSFFLLHNGGQIKESIKSIPNLSTISVNFILLGGSKPNSNAYNQKYNHSISTCPFFLDSDGTPTSWLEIIDAQIKEYTNTSSSTHFLLLNSLPNELVAELGPKITKALSSKEPYSALKAIITEKYTVPAIDILNKYIKQHTIDDQLPSVFLTSTIKDLETIHPGITSNKTLVRNYFLNALPQRIQSIVEISSSENGEELARMADRVSLTFKDSSNTRHPAANSLSMHENTIIEQISTLTKRLDMLTSTNNTHNISSAQRTLLCYYHRKFAESAKACCIGCTWEGSKNKVKILPICVYHNLFGAKANRCLEGCTFKTSASSNNEYSKQKN